MSRESTKRKPDAKEQEEEQSAAPLKKKRTKKVYGPRTVATRSQKVDLELQNAEHEFKRAQAERIMALERADNSIEKELLRIKRNPRHCRVELRFTGGDRRVWSVLQKDIAEFETLLTTNNKCHATGEVLLDKCLCGAVHAVDCKDEKNCTCESVRRHNTSDLACPANKPFLDLLDKLIDNPASEIKNAKAGRLLSPLPTHVEYAFDVPPRDTIVNHTIVKRVVHPN